MYWDKTIQKSVIHCTSNSTFYASGKCLQEDFFTGPPLQSRIMGGGGTQKQKISNMEVTSKPVNHFSGLNHALANPEWLPHLSQPQV